METLNYSYDSLGRLTAVFYPDRSCTGYQYDAAGNRTQYVSTTALAPTAIAVPITGYQDLVATFDPRAGTPSCVGLTISAVGSPTAPAHGSASIGSGGASISYTPTTGFTGSDAFSYTISNGTQSSTGTVNVTIVAPTLGPVANSGRIYFQATTPPNVTPNGVQSLSAIASDPYGYALTVSSYSQPVHGGTVSYNGGSFIYYYSHAVSRLQTNDSFTYTVSDGHGHSAIGTVPLSNNVDTNQ